MASQPEPTAIPAPVGLWCLRCYYDLRGLPSRQCPECGRPFSLDDPASYSTDPRSPTLRQRTVRAIHGALHGPTPPARPPQVLRLRLGRLLSEQQELQHRYTVLMRLYTGETDLSVAEAEARVDAAVGALFEPSERTASMEQILDWLGTDNPAAAGEAEARRSITADEVLAWLMSPEERDPRTDAEVAAALAGEG